LKHLLVLQEGERRMQSLKAADEDELRRMREQVKLSSVELHPKP